MFWDRKIYQEIGMDLAKAVFNAETAKKSAKSRAVVRGAEARIL